MQIEHIIFLIHPCCYEPLGPDAIRRDNLQLFVDREKEVKARWLEALAQRPANTLLVQLGGPTALRDEAVEYLGAAAVFYPSTEFPEDGNLAEYYRRLAADFNAHVSAHGWHLDGLAFAHHGRHPQALRCRVFRGAGGRGGDPGGTP